MFQISKMKESAACNGRRSFLALRELLVADNDTVQRAAGNNVDFRTRAARGSGVSRIVICQLRSQSNDWVVMSLNRVNEGLRGAHVLSPPP